MEINQVTVLIACLVCILALIAGAGIGYMTRPKREHTFQPPPQRRKDDHHDTDDDDTDNDEEDEV